MKFTPLAIKDAYLIECTEFLDERGAFSRLFCEHMLREYDIHFMMKQSSLSKNKKKGVLRGMHYQTAPFGEQKIVTCVKGAGYDVFVDLRPKSPTYLTWVGIELTETNNKMVFIPKQCAHGFQTLLDDTSFLYYIDTIYHPEASTGVRYNDPAIGIQWPPEKTLIISEKDQTFPLIVQGTD